MEESSDLSDGRWLIANSNCITIHSGNVLYELLQTSGEICKSFCGIVQSWIEGKQAGKLIQCRDFDGCLCIANKKDDEAMSEQRSDLKISLKLFLEQNLPSVAEEAVMTVINGLNCEKLDSVLLSLPPTSSCPKQTFRSIKYNQIKEVWEKLESLVDNGLILELGVCDFDTESLRDIYQSSKIKPTTNQINLAHCCTPPDELSVLCNAHNINLLTHNDPIEILPHDTLQHVLPENDGRLWNATYLARYSSVVKYRQIVKSKGYYLCIKSG